MEEIRKACKEYSADDIYNTDETGFFWKQKPDRNLSTFEASEKKSNKARITANLCCNTTGTDQLLIWFIGTACRPNCFRAEWLYTIDHLDTHWSFNKIAWMIYHIMIE